MIKHSKVLMASCLLGAATIFSACEKKESKNDDLSIQVVNTSVPISSAEICGHTENNVLNVVSGTQLDLQLHLTGSNRLAQYKVEIHSNFDCHGHDNPPSLDWYYSKIVDLNSDNIVLDEQIEIPAEAKSGNYHCMLRLVDEKGNESEFVEFVLVIKNSIDSVAPTIVLNPSLDSITIQKGQILNFVGQIEDNLNLKNGAFELEYKDAAGHEDHIDELSTQFPATDNTIFALDKSYTIPASMPTGWTIFYLEAKDYYNNKGAVEIHVNITD